MRKLQSNIQLGEFCVSTPFCHNGQRLDRLANGIAHAIGRELTPDERADIHALVTHWIKCRNARDFETYC